MHLKVLFVSKNDDGSVSQRGAASCGSSSDQHSIMLQDVTCSSCKKSEAFAKVKACLAGVA